MESQRITSICAESGMLFEALPELWRSESSQHQSKDCIFLSDKVLSVTATTDNISCDNDTNECTVILKSGRFDSPMGGVSFNMSPVLKKGETMVSLGVRYSVKFPVEIHWGQGGYLPGLFGVYSSAVSTSAAANSLFEGKMRWDAKGRLGVNLKQNFEHDALEWQVDTQEKIQLSRDVWYDVCLVVHIDGAFQVLVNGVSVFGGSSHVGFERIDGVRFCAYCVDNLGRDDSVILIKDLEIRAEIDLE